MKNLHKTVLIATASSLITALAVALLTARWVQRNTFESTAQISNAMESYNNVGRLEAYDFLEALLQKGCNEEALSFIDHQQGSLLNGIRDHMRSEPVRAIIMERSAEIATRALAEAPGPSDYTYPKCE